MPYSPDWERLDAAVNRIARPNAEQTQAKKDICHAIADGKITVRVRLVRGNAVFFGGNVAPPHQIEPADIDWTNSRPRTPWAIGPMLGQHYSWDWAKEHIDLLELCTADVTEVLKPEPQLPVGYGGNKYKRTAVDAVINEIGIVHLVNLSLKEREIQVMEHVKSKFGLSVSDRYVRDRLKEHRLRTVPKRS